MFAELYVGLRLVVLGDAARAVVLRSRLASWCALSGGLAADLEKPVLRRRRIRWPGCGVEMTSLSGGRAGPAGRRALGEATAVVDDELSAVEGGSRGTKG